MSGGPFQPACAPDDDNHVNFYENSPAPSWHATATAFGHNDMLDDAPMGCFLVCDACPSGPDRTGLRAISAGLTVALFRSALQGSDDALALISDSANFPGDVDLELK
jgi:hypothetical protein